MPATKINDMKQKLSILAAAALTLTACNNSTPKLENMTDSVSWIMGENVGRTLTEGNVIDIDNEVFMQAVRHTLEGKEQPLSEEAYNEGLQIIMQMAQMQMMKEQEATRSATTGSQEDYFRQLEANNPNIKKHESGFYYEVIKEGKGRKAKYGDNVSFDYRSYLMLSGEPFDQTYGQREPISHVVGEPMFRGLIEGLQLMNPGSIYRFYFPYQLAFGKKGANGIPGYTPFIYEVEMHNFI